MQIGEVAMAFTLVERDPGEARLGSLRCLVVDHQAATLEQLAGMLRAHPDVARVSTAADSLGALRVLHHDDVDVAFIEVRMPGMDGMELARVFKRLRVAPAVVFVSRCPQRAAEAFDLGAVDYLNKPPPATRLAESVRRAVAVRRPASSAPGRPHAADADDELIPVELFGITKLVRRSGVRWAQAQRDYVRLHTADGSYLIRARLSALADSWRTTGMVRIHRSYLVQSRLITTVEVADSGGLTVVVDGRRLPVSRRMAPKLRGDLPRREVPPDRIGRCGR
jgi:DNA-binding LytR/AlgR family response regulator